MNLSRKRILVVEDELAVASRLQQAISETGAAVIGPAATVDEACTLLDANKIDAAVLDLIADGVYCDAIARELVKRQIPFAVTTGVGASAEHPELRQAVTITKPFQAEHVQDVLASLLDQKRG